jgi:hypothetical protein
MQIDEDRPWEQIGAVRRDCEPHRGTFLNALATIGLIFSVLSCFGGLAAIFGLPMCITAWILAEQDLKKIRARIMDPAGGRLVGGARLAAIDGVILSLGFGTLWLWAALSPFLP